MSHKTSDHVSAVGGPPGDRWKTVDQDGEAVHKPSDYLDTIDRSSGDGGPMKRSHQIMLKVIVVSPASPCP